MSLFRTSRGRLSAAAIAVVPLLYSAAYLGAFWNPYGHLNRIPIAVINRDQGTDGRVLVTELQKHFTVDVDRPSTATRALKNGRVGLVMTIPAHYSFDVKHARTVPLTFRSNPGTNYLTSILMQHEAQALADSLAATVRQKTLTAVGSGMSRLTSAAKQMADGAASASNGLGTIAAHDAALSSGSRTLSLDQSQIARALSVWQGGAAQVVQYLGNFDKGSAEALQGASTLAGVAGSIGQGDQRISDAAAQLSSSSAALSTQAQKLQGGSGQLSQGASALESAVQENAALTHEIESLAAQESAAASAQTMGQMDTLLQQQSQLENKMLQSTATLRSSAQGLWQGSGAVAGGLEQLSSGLRQEESAGQSVASGAREWAAQASSWEQGVGALNEGATRLSQAIGSLGNSAGALSQQESALGHGMTRWAQGSAQAASALGTLSQRMGALSHGAGRIAAETPRLAKPLSAAEQPVTAQVSAMGHDNYGTGMAPYFLGLSLWVGAVVATVLVPGGRYRKAALRSRTWHSLAVALLQIGLLGAGSVVVLPMHPLHGWAYALSVVGIGLVWWAVIRLLVEKFGDAGRILGIVLLVIQLAGSGGTYPVILSPALFQAIHPYLPMTWAIHVLRWTLSNGYPNRAAGDALRLAVLGVAAIALVRWWPAQWLFEAPVLKNDEETAEAERPLPHGIA